MPAPPPQPAPPVPAPVPPLPPGYLPPPGHPGAYPPPPYGYPPGYYPYPPPPGYYPYGMGGYPDLRPHTLPYDESEPPPPGYKLDTRIYRGLVIAGATTFGSLYILSAAVGAAFQEDRDGEEHAPLFAPVIGPFITMGTADTSSLGVFVLILDGVGQAAGVAMFVAGLAAKNKIWVRTQLGPMGFLPVAPTGHPGFGMELSL